MCTTSSTYLENPGTALDIVISDPAPLIASTIEQVSASGFLSRGWNSPLVECQDIAASSEKALIGKRLFRSHDRDPPANLSSQVTQRHDTRAVTRWHRPALERLAGPAREPPA